MISESETSIGAPAPASADPTVRRRGDTMLTFSRQVRPRRQPQPSGESRTRKPATIAVSANPRNPGRLYDPDFAGLRFTEAGAGPEPSFLQEVNRQPMLTAAEEASLSERVQAGSDAARERLVMSHLRLVVKLAFGYAGLGLPVADLISEGSLGLMRATALFNPAFGTRFSTYATVWVKKHIRDALTRQSRLVRLPASVVYGAARIKSAEDRLRRKLGRPPTDAELSEDTEILREQIDSLRDATEQCCVSLDGVSAPDGEGPTLAETLADDQAEPPDETLARRSDRDYAEALLAQLRPREARVLRLRFGLDDGCERSLEEVARCVGLARQRVHQIEAASLSWLRNRARLAELNFPE
jgi:RNA polymerase sigma factor (sigma-70 family)